MTSKNPSANRVQLFLNVLLCLHLVRNPATNFFRCYLDVMTFHYISSFQQISKRKSAFKNPNGCFPDIHQTSGCSEVHRVALVGNHFYMSKSSAGQIAVRNKSPFIGINLFILIGTPSDFSFLQWSNICLKTLSLLSLSSWATCCHSPVAVPWFCV